MRLLQSALIYRKIARNNARHVLFSLAHWLSINSSAGLLLEIDIRRLGFARRPLPTEREGLYYTKAALLDSYELLRQLVDNTDELMNCCVVVIAAPEFLTDQNRGLDAYVQYPCRHALSGQCLPRTMGCSGAAGGGGQYAGL